MGKENKPTDANGDKLTNENEDKGTEENESKAKRRNFNFNRLDGIIWAFISIFIFLGIYVIYVSNFREAPKFLDEYWIVIAGTLSLVLFTLNSIERLWQKCYWGRKPHQYSRVGWFVLAALLFASVTFKEAAEEVADQQKLTGDIADSTGTIVDKGVKAITGSTDTIVDKGVKKANDFTKKYSDSLGVSFSQLLIVSSEELAQVINQRDLEQQTQVTNLGLKVKEAFDQLGANLQGQAELVKSLGLEVKKAFSDLDNNLKRLV